MQQVWEDGRCANIDNDEVPFRTRWIRESRLVRQLVIQSLLRSPLRVLLFIFLHLPSIHDLPSRTEFSLSWPHEPHQSSLRSLCRQAVTQERETTRAKKKEEEEGSANLPRRQRLACGESSSVSSETLASHLINAFVNRQTRCGEWSLMVTRSRSVGCWTKVPLRRRRNSRRLRAKIREGGRKRVCVC